MALKESGCSAEYKTACEVAIRQPLAEHKVAPAPQKEATTFPVYVVGLRTLIKGRGIDDAKLVGYQMLTSYDGGSAVIAEAPADEKAGLRSASRITGPSADAALEAYRKVRKRKEVQAHTFEPRVLRIPALRIEAFWLKAAGAEDLVVPYQTYSQELLKKTVLSMPEFLEALQPLAKRESERARPRD